MIASLIVSDSRTAAKRCRTCKQPLPQGPRIRLCARCGEPIRLHDKWVFMTRRKRTAVEHRNCDNPESYT